MGIPATATPAVHAASPDGELIRLCRESDEMNRRIMAVYPIRALAEAEEECDRLTAPLQAALDDLLNHICAVRATAPEGFKARARTLALWNPDVLKTAGEEGAYWEDRMVAALVRDMLAGGVA